MDYVTRQFINLTKKFRKELRKYQETLHRDLAHISDGFEHLKDAIDRKHQPEPKSAETQPVTVAELRGEIPISVKTYAQRGTVERIWGKVKGALEVAVGIAVVLYTVLTWNIWQEQTDATNFAARQTELSRKSLNETTRQMQREYRAWIKMTVGSGGSFVYGEPMVVPINIANIGKTPAKNVSGDIALYLMGQHENPRFLYGEEGRKQGYPSYHYSTNIVMQNDSTDNPLVMTQHGKEGRANLIWSKELQAKIENRDLWIVVHGRFDYKDIFGTLHWQTFCYMPMGEKMMIGGTGKTGEHVGNDACEAYEATDNN